MANAMAFSTGDARRSLTTTVLDGLRIGGRSAMVSGGAGVRPEAGLGAGVASGALALNEPEALLAGSATTRGEDTGDEDGGPEICPLAFTLEPLSNEGGNRVLSGDSSAGAVTGSRMTGGMSVLTCTGAGTFVGPDEA